MVAGLAFLSKKGFNPANKSNQKSVWEARQRKEVDEKKVKQLNVVFVWFQIVSHHIKMTTIRQEIEQISFEENEMMKNWLGLGVGILVQQRPLLHSCMRLPQA
jgi:hypothetical protein